MNFIGASAAEPSRMRKTMGNVLALLVLGVALFLFFPPFYLGYLSIISFVWLLWEIGVRIKRRSQRCRYVYGCLVFFMLGYASAWSTSHALEQYGREACREYFVQQYKQVYVPDYAGFADGYGQYEAYVWQHGEARTQYFYSDAHVSIFPFVNVLHFGGGRRGRFCIAICVCGFYFKVTEANEWYSCA